MYNSMMVKEGFEGSITKFSPIVRSYYLNICMEMNGNHFDKLCEDA